MDLADRSTAALIFADNPDVGAADGNSTGAAAAIVEYQLNFAIGAGAGQLVVFVDWLPPAMHAVFDRFRRTGRTISLVRSASDAAAAIPRTADIILLARGIIPITNPLRDESSPAVVTLDGSMLPQGQWERIDARDHWAGLALITGEQLHETVSMLGEWDLQSTLLRRRVQAGCRRITIGPDRVIDASDEAVLAAYQHQLLRNASDDVQALPWGRVVARLAPSIFGSLPEFGHGVAVTAGVAAIGLAASIGASAWHWTSIGLISLALTLASVDLTRLRLATGGRVRSGARDGATLIVRWMIGGLALAGLAWFRSDWGYWPTAAMFLATWIILENGRVRRPAAVGQTIFRVEPETCLIASAALALLGSPALALTAGAVTMLAAILVEQNVSAALQD